MQRKKGNKLNAHFKNKNKRNMVFLKLKIPKIKSARHMTT